MKRLLLIALLIIAGCSTPQIVLDKQTAECIGSKSTLYISTGCVACEKQRKIFGDYYQDLHVLDCKKDPKKCVEKNIITTPTWMIGENEIRGVQSIETLKDLTKC